MHFKSFPIISWDKTSYIFYMPVVNNIAADDLVTQGAKVSAAMMLT